VPRQVNWEVRSTVANLYYSGYRSPREIASKLAELGYSYRPSYVKKLLWDLRRRGLLGGKAPPVWEDFEAWKKGLRIHLVSAKELLLMNDAKGALRELNSALECLQSMERAYEVIRVAYAKR
jgi:hypothetical protein